MVFTLVNSVKHGVGEILLQISRFLESALAGTRAFHRELYLFWNISFYGFYDEQDD